MTTAEFAAFVAAWKSHGQRQKDLAARLGCKPSSITEWMQGKRVVPARYEERITLIQQQWRDGIPAISAALKQDIQYCDTALQVAITLSLRYHLGATMQELQTLQASLRERLRFLEEMAK